MPAVYVTRPLPEAVISPLRAFAEVEVRSQTLPMTADETAAALETFDAVLPTLGDPLGASAFAAAPLRAKLLANFGVGYNHIDVAAAAKAGVAVTNTPGAVTDATADIAVMLMLMAARRASEGEAAVRDGSWPGWHPTQYLGLHVTGKTLGVVGMGRIGKAIARRCHFGFGMEVVFYNRSPVADASVPARQLDSIEAVAAAADVLSVSVPGGAANHHLINADVMAAMGPQAILVNTARGDVVDEAALIVALTEGRIGAAGLDVYEGEPQVPEALRALPNVSLLPHLGTAALEVRTQMGLMAVDNLRAHFAGEALPNLVAP
ncbi:MAG: D-glycerate dehydrogenase [Pseudomonadota bacterium]